MTKHNRGDEPPYVITAWSETARRGGRLDASYYVNTARGKRPYVIRHGKLVQARWSEMQRAVYLRPAEAKRIQEMNLDQAHIVEEIEKLFEK